MEIGEAFVYVVPLKRIYFGRKSNRAKRAIDYIRKFVSRHAKVNLEDVVIMDDVNSYIWSNSIEKPPRRVKILVEMKEFKPEEGEAYKKVLVRLAGEKVRVGKYEIKNKQ
ncbi:ribosomal protein L31E [Caldisphaera lagunensis DSM 15908]|uniref:Large ribosomal subunit protein eL31 n=1 Tax=Caldisphaera lagunensis (strain DSM 15908 / JCM 11604 / ANMR 0165 / IC-154) TaxID=1056495 RepID=L0AAP2_CALLD|nr:50S ribosomal protein L31e [Caldisphaera lagunensis]AFZ70177.1 ribosomal protein L31E [Caldisphaera lagunensis DSM 15908]